MCVWAPPKALYRQQVLNGLPSVARSSLDHDFIKPSSPPTPAPTPPRRVTRERLSTPLLMSLNTASLSSHVVPVHAQSTTKTAAKTHESGFLMLPHDRVVTSDLSQLGAAQTAKVPQQNGRLFPPRDACICTHKTCRYLHYCILYIE